MSRRNLILSLIILFILPPVAAFAQLDLKNSLPDLTAKYRATRKDTSAVKLALTISKFYMNNMGYSRQNIDSCHKYLTLATNISRALRYKKGIEDAEVVKVALLLKHNKFNDAQKLATNATGALYCRLHIIIGKFFLEKDGEHNVDMDIADKSFLKAQKYADEQRMPMLSLTNRAHRYPLMLERKVNRKISDRFLANTINICREYHDKRTEAQLWYIKGSYDSTESQAILSMDKSIKAALIAKDTDIVIRAMKDKADFNLRQAKFDIAQKQLLEVLKIGWAAGYKNQQYTYDLLSAVQMAKGNFETAMRYGLNAVQCADSTGTEIGINYIQFRLANICRDMGLKKESITWYQKCLDNTIKIDGRFPYFVFRELATSMIKEGKADQVLKNLTRAIKKYPPDETKIFFIPMIRADCYQALNKPQLAEKYYLQVIDAFEARNYKDSYYYLSYKNIAEFYIKQKQYNNAATYLQKILESKNTLLPITDLAIAHQLQFKVDSANGNYLSGIKHFEAAKAITDSIFNQVKLRQTEQLQLQFETAKRDHENLVLRNNNNLQRSALEKAGLSRKLISMVLIGSILVIGLMIYLYRAKQKSNNILKARQEEINNQNHQLNLLLHEKEWLMKEIHHRVKNNLQIISSLLNTQSSYLDNEEALTAIRDSQNRMQAISIVHQKLYQADDMATINLGIYIEELAYSIRDSFKAQQVVRFDFDIASIRLTTADTVPLGLILNEAITNSVKYAFTDWEQGVVAISMFETKEGQYQLNIQDNGIGLPVDFDINKCSSLGINLMMGLSEQLSGKFSIHSNNGTLITIVFHPSSI